VVLKNRRIFIDIVFKAFLKSRWWNHLQEEYVVLYSQEVISYVVFTVFLLIAGIVVAVGAGYWQQYNYFGIGFVSAASSSYGASSVSFSFVDSSNITVSACFSD